jgi:putative FmdB family regulatory protein
MPIYEFACENCRHNFEELCRASGVEVQCPVCGSARVIKKVSGFNARSSGSEGPKSLNSGSCSSCQGGHCHTCH